MSEINIYVKAIDTSPHYEFYTDSVGTTELTPTNTLYTNNTYIFNRLNNETSHPFFISDVGYEQESTSAITITTYPISSGSNDYSNGIKNNDLLKLEFNTLTSSDTLYYYCTSHSSMVSTFVLIDPPAAAIFNSYVNVNDNLIVTGNITLDGDISGSGSNLYDIPNSGLVNNSITINSQNVALGESVTLIASQWTTDSNAIYYDGGNVGIQTSDPSYTLDVSGSVNCSELLVNGTAPSFGGDGSSYVQLDSTYVTPSETYANPDQNTISLETNNWNLDFLNNIYYNTGNVGIGVDTASFELDVSGSVNCTELLVNGTAPTFGGEYVLYDDTYETSALDYREVSANISTTSSTTSSGVWDLSDSNTISYTNGNVGIGTTDPAYELDVSGNIYANENIYANGDMYIYGSHLRLDNSVTGATTGIHINMKHKDATHDARALLVHQDTPDILQINYGYDFDTVRINNTVFIDGSCGIGTTSPSERLTINQNTSIPCLGVRNGNSAYGYSRAQIAFGYSGTNTYQHFIQTRHNGGGTSGNAIDFYVCDTTQNNSITSGVTHTMSLDGGNVGIGTTSPNELLSIQSAPSTDAAIEVSTQSEANSAIIYLGTPHNFDNTIPRKCAIIAKGTGGLGIPAADGGGWSRSDLHFCLEDSISNDVSNANVTHSKMIIKNNGYVGIGTTSPSSTLHVYGNSSPSLTVEYPGNSVILQSWKYTSDIGTYRGMELYSPGDWSSSSFSGFSNTFIFRTADAFSFYTDDNHVCHMGGGGQFIVYNFLNSSDDRLKSNEIPITDALTTIMKLNPMTYDKYNNMDKSGNYFRESGLISQDIWYQVPELRHIVTLGSEYKDGTSTVPTPIDVSNNELLEDADYNNLGWSTTEPSSVKYLSLIAYLIKAVQELNIQRQQEKDALQASHDSLQASHDSLKNELAELKILLQEKSVI
jgi:hypothetical protein